MKRGMRLLEGNARGMTGSLPVAKRLVFNAAAHVIIRDVSSRTHNLGMATSYPIRPSSTSNNSPTVHSSTQSSLVLAFDFPSTPPFDSLIHCILSYAVETSVVRRRVSLVLRFAS